MEPDSTPRLRKAAGNIFGYDPGFLREEFACMIGPILAHVGLKKLMPNVSKPLSEEEISLRIARENLGVFTKDITSLLPWYVSGGHIRSVVQTKDGNYVLGSFFES